MMSPKPLKERIGTALVFPFLLAFLAGCGEKHTGIELKILDAIGEQLEISVSHRDNLIGAKTLPFMSAGPLSNHETTVILLSDELAEETLVVKAREIRSDEPGRTIEGSIRLKARHVVELVIAFSDLPNQCPEPPECANPACHLHPDCATAPKCEQDSECEDAFCMNGYCRDGCLIEETFVEPGTPREGDPCWVCDPSMATDTWSPASGVVACGDGLICDANGNCTEDAPLFTLVIRVQGAGRGRVVSEEALVDCPSGTYGSCTTKILAGTRVSLEAIAEDGSQFARWGWRNSDNEPSREIVMSTQYVWLDAWFSSSGAACRFNSVNYQHEQEFLLYVDHEPPCCPSEPNCCASQKWTCLDGVPTPELDDTNRVFRERFCQEYIYSGERCSDGTIYVARMNEHDYYMTPGNIELSCDQATACGASSGECLPYLHHWDCLRAGSQHIATSARDLDDGLQNTHALEPEDRYHAAAACAKHTHPDSIRNGRLEDWFLPAVNELRLLGEHFDRYYPFVLCDSNSSCAYWSSTEANVSTAKSVSFSFSDEDGVPVLHAIDVDQAKSSALRVRCMRKEPVVQRP